MMVGKLAALCLLVLYCVAVRAANPIVTPFDTCTNCGIANVLWPSDSVYVLLTFDGNLYRSIDEGQNWALIQSQVRAIFQFNSVRLSMLVLKSNGDLYSSVDGAATLVSHPTPATINAINLHPNMAGWVLVETCSSTSCIVRYSHDYGATWQQSATELFNYYPAMWSPDSNSPDTIFGLRTDQSFGYTPDYGDSWTILFPRSIGYVITNHFLFVGIISGTSAKLYSSSNRTDPSHTIKSQYLLDEFPFGSELPEQGYTFLDDTTRSEFIAVKKESPLWGNLFSSDFDGDQFTLSLKFVAERNLDYDFDKFAGLAGIYLANSYPSEKATNKQTSITFDNGGEWRLLKAPQTDYSGAPLNCDITKGCSLHLHGLLSWYNNSLFPPFYSSPNAIGLMAAVGNIGTAVSLNNTEVGTYVSTNAGLTWSQILNQPTIYEFGDHGGILVYAITTSVTNSVYYSTNYGATSTSYIFTSLAIYVDNIFIEPQGTGRKFVLIGHLGTKNYIFGLDFTPVTPTACTDSDYEIWSPTDAEHGTQFCFMGSITTYQRRKATSQCYNDRDTDHIVTQTPCDCVFADYECDIGFYPSPRNSTFGFSCTSKSTQSSCATGYRLIPDTKCTGGLDLASKGCPGYSGSPSTGATATTSAAGPSGNSSHSGAVVGITLLFIFLIGGAATAGILYWKNDRFRSFVLEKLGRSSDPAYGRLNTAVDDEPGF